MAYYDNFKRLDDLNIAFKASTANAAEIFGNGLNQVQITIGVSILDVNNDPVVMTDQEMLDSVYLCDYTTGENIPVGSGPDWNYSATQGGYATAYRYYNLTVAQASFENGYNYLQLYLSCNQQSDGKVTAAGINIPTVGDFETTVNGTATGNGPDGVGSSFVKPDKVTVVALPPYKYVLEDFSLNTETQKIGDSEDCGAILYNVEWRNFYLDIVKSGHAMKSVAPSKPSAARIACEYQTHWIAQSFDFAEDYGKGQISKTVYIEFGDYDFSVTGTINKQAGVCFSVINGDCTLPTAWWMDGNTYVTITDQYGNTTKPLLEQSGDNMELIGFSG